MEFSQWESLKPKTPYGQLPIMTMNKKSTESNESETISMTQSDAMLRFAGRLDSSDKLYPASLRTQIDEAIGLIADLDRQWRPALYIGMSKGLKAFGYPDDISKEDAEGLKKKLRENFLAEDLPRFLGYFEAMLTKSGGPFLFGANPTIADCQLLPTLRKYQKGYIDYVPKSSLDINPVVSKYIVDMLSIPKIKDWYSAH